MNILFIENSLSPTQGGVERVTFTLSEGLVKRGHRSFIAFTNEDSDCVPQNRKLQLPKSGYETWLNMLTKLICEQHISVLIVQNKYAEWQIAVYYELKRKLGIKIVSVLHCNPDIWINKNKWRLTFMDVYLKELFRSAYFYLVKNKYVDAQLGMYHVSDKYVLLSERFILVFKRINRVDDIENKLTSINNPCSFSDSYELSDKDNVILVVARMAEQQKRISNVLWIWAKLQAKHKDWSMEIIGDGPDLERYKSLAGKLKLERIKFEGKSTQPEEFYKKAKLFMMTSVWEGFCMTLVEAQHYGCVPFAFDSFAAVHDIIDSGHNGVIIPLHDIDEYVRQMDAVMCNDKLWHNMSVEAKLSADSKYDIQNILDRWDELLRSL